MKRFLSSNFIVVTVLVLPLLYCGCSDYPKPTGRQVAEMLLNDFNTKLPGSKFHVKPENRIGKRLENNRYRIIFKDIVYTSDLSNGVVGLNKILPSVPALTEYFTDTAKIKEMVMTYTPNTDHLIIHWAKGFQFQVDIPKAKQIVEATRFKAFNLKRFHITIGKVTYNDLNIHDLLKEGKKDKIKKISDGSQDGISTSDSKIEHMIYEVRGITQDNDELDIAIDIPGFSDVEPEESDHISTNYMLYPDAPPPDLSRLLKEGITVSSLHIQTGRINISIKMNGKPWGAGFVDNAFYAQYIKPNQLRSHFQIGQRIHLEKIRLNAPEQEKIEQLCHINHFIWDISMRHADPPVTLSWLTILKQIAGVKKTNTAGEQNVVLAYAMQFLTKMIESKAVAQINFNLDHFFGKIDLRAHLRLHPFFQIESKQVVSIPQIDLTFKKIEDSGILSPEILRGLKDGIKKNMVRQENGDATMTTIRKPDDPGYYYFNGIRKQIGKK